MNWNDCWFVLDEATKQPAGWSFADQVFILCLHGLTNFLEITDTKCSLNMHAGKVFGKIQKWLAREISGIYQRWRVFIYYYYFFLLLQSRSRWQIRLIFTVPLRTVFQFCSSWKNFRSQQSIVYKKHIAYFVDIIHIEAAFFVIRLAKITQQNYLSVFRHVRLRSQKQVYRTNSWLSNN